MARRIPLDFKALAKESGMNGGKVCRSPVFGWVVQNTRGLPGPDMACITPPPMDPGETKLKIEDAHWVFE